VGGFQEFIIPNEKNNQMTTNKDTLQKYYELAREAFYWISFSPDIRASETISQFSNELETDLCNIPADDRKDYQSKYESLFTAWLKAKGRCRSSAITGSAGFSLRKAQAANVSENQCLNDFVEWRKRALTAIAKKQKQARPQEVKDKESIDKLKSDIDYIAQVKAQGLPCNPSLLVANLYGRLQTISKTGRVAVIEEVVLYALERGVITKRHKMNGLIELASLKKEVPKNISFKFDGGELLINYQIERVQILFENIPDVEMRTRLKSSGFRFSPRHRAWQRKSTAQGVMVAKKIVGL